ARPARPRPAHRPPAAQPGPGPTPGRRRRASLGAAAGQGQRPRTDLDPDRGARVEIGQWTRASAGRAHWRVHAIAAGLSLGPWRPGPAQRERRTRHQERTMRHSYTLAAAVLLVACGGGDTGPAVDTPGRDRQPDTRLLEAGAGLLQDKPIDAVNSYLDGFHFYSGDMDGQMEAHHYCSLLNEDVIQRVIYDGNVAEARIMGVECIIGGTLFRQLSSRAVATARGQPATRRRTTTPAPWRQANRIPGRSGFRPTCRLSKASVPGCAASVATIAVAAIRCGAVAAEAAPTGVASPARGGRQQRSAVLPFW